MKRALIAASLENQGGVYSNTHLARIPALTQFINFVKGHSNAKKLEHIDKETVRAFGEHLKEQYEHGELSHVTARDYLSHVNSTIAQARGDKALVVKATKELNFAPKSGIALQDASVSDSLHNKVIRDVVTEIRLVMRLQRHFGLRFREACLFNAKQAFKEVDKASNVTVARGTKGGQSRVLVVDTNQQLRVLKEVADYQIEHETESLIPQHSSFKDFQKYAWRQTKEADDNYRSHGERHFYATNFYLKHVGAKCPVQAAVPHGKPHYQYIATMLDISIDEARALDRAVRLELSKRLGHHRVEVTNSYVG
ncbi:integrase domain-containing protein [Vibrio barjaei]|uniref:integrase domain-containing protein n=1 Tax=Vibrio barjaei TaxID=1676683 RepID=UPI002283D0A5|nr:integrase domain-containing protein [Vibrio barjaei]MCY9874886.1 integrase domain-containing protein [Vibrio barjaei]